MRNVNGEVSIDNSSYDVVKVVAHDNGNVYSIEASSKDAKCVCSALFPNGHERKLVDKTAVTFWGPQIGESPYDEPIAYLQRFIYYVSGEKVALIEYLDGDMDRMEEDDWEPDEEGLYSEEDDEDDEDD